MASKPSKRPPSSASMPSQASRICASLASLSKAGWNAAGTPPRARWQQAPSRISRVSSSIGSISASARSKPAGNQSYSLNTRSAPSTLAASFTSVPPTSMPINIRPAARAGSLSNTGAPAGAAAASSRAGGSVAMSRGAMQKAAPWPHSAASVRSLTFRHLP